MGFKMISVNRSGLGTTNQHRGDGQLIKMTTGYVNSKTLWYVLGESVRKYKIRRFLLKFCDINMRGFVEIWGFVNVVHIIITRCTLYIPCQLRVVVSCLLAPVWDQACNLLSYRLFRVDEAIGGSVSLLAPQGCALVVGDVYLSVFQLRARISMVSLVCEGREHACTVY